MHECPDCGQMCCCNGDIDDIDSGPWRGCEHYKTADCDHDDDFDDEDYYP